jgi:hypothetical protein
VPAAADVLDVPKLEPDSGSRRLSQADALPHNFELRLLLPPWPLLGALAATCVPPLLLETFTSEGDNIAGVLALAAVALVQYCSELAAGGARRGRARGSKGRCGRSAAECAGVVVGPYGRPNNEVTRCWQQT